MWREILQSLPVLAFSYAGQVLLKRGAQQAGALNWSLILADPILLLKSLLNVNVILGFILSGIGAIFYLVVLSRTDLTTALPILGALGFLLLPLIGYVFLQESLDIGRIGGIVIIAIGMLIVARS